MKILINGNTVSEVIKIKTTKEQRVAPLASELSITTEDIMLIDRIIGHIKRNKKMYLKLVILLAMTIDSTTLTAYATTGNFDEKLVTIWDTIKSLLFAAGKFSCMGLGLKEMIICLIDGGNIKEATYSGMQYWLGYIFLQLYPSLYNLVEGLEF